MIPSTYLKALTEHCIYVVIFNILMTVPFGMYLRYYYKASFKKVLFLSFFLSLFFELTQLTGLYFIYPKPYRLFDVDDLILNTLGGLLGYFLVKPLMKILPTREEIDNNALKKGENTLKEFKEFISKGNIVDMAVGVIIGSAFGKIVTSLVNDIFMPIIGVIIGGLDFSNLSIKVGNSAIMYGSFIQNVVDFLIVAACIFFMIKVLSKFKKKEEVKTETTIDENTLLLREIRDLLKKEK